MLPDLASSYSENSLGLSYSRPQAISLIGTNSLNHLNLAYFHLILPVIVWNDCALNFRMDFRIFKSDRNSREGLRSNKLIIVLLWCEHPSSFAITLLLLTETLLSFLDLRFTFSRS